MSSEQTDVAWASRRFGAPPDRVFTAWISPRIVSRWVSASMPGDHVLHLVIDARVGCFFSFSLRRQGEVIEHRGKYLEVVPPSRLVFTWGEATPSSGRPRVTVTIEESDGGSMVTVTHEIGGTGPDHVDQATASWKRMLEAMATVIGEDSRTAGG